MAPGTLHFFCGKAGAGKSTLASALARSSGGLLISEDVWLDRLFGDQMRTFDDYIRYSRRLKTVIGPHVVDLLKTGQSVILDFPGNTRATRGWFLTVSELAGAPHVLHHLEASDALCLHRVAQRNNALPEGAHRLSEEDFRHVTSYFEPPVEAGLHIEVHPQGP